MKRKELDYFHIGPSLGGNQDWFTDPWMKMGGCAAECACDSCIYLTCRKGMEHLYPYDGGHLSRADYVRFAMIMKPYLKPRFSGIDKLPIYTEGFQNYLQDAGAKPIAMKTVAGTADAEECEQAVQEQIDRDLPVQMLLLNLKDKTYEDYEWHWFTLAGYDHQDGKFLVKAITYGKGAWLDFSALWAARADQRGGLVLYEI